jgi:oligopeptide transport system substrate-binding protein
MIRKRVLACFSLVIVLMTLAPILAACGTLPAAETPETAKGPAIGPSDSSPDLAEPLPEPLPTRQKPPDEPEPPVVLHWNLGTEPPTLDPALATDSVSIDVDEQLFLGLTAFDPDTGEVIPELATSWKVSSEGALYTFQLREDVYWIRYDPATMSFEKIRPVTAYDVEYGVRRTVMPETASDYAYVLYIIKNAEKINTTSVPTDTYDIETLGVRALDDYTIEFELEYPAGFFPAIAGMWVARPQPKDAIEEYGTDWTEPGNLMSNAAYALSEWTHDSHLTLVKNPHYYRADQVQIDIVDCVMVVDASTAFAMYENNELDAASVPLDDLDRVRDDKVLSKELYIAPDVGTYYYGFTTTKPPFDNVHVRRAFSYAIDRQSLIDNVLKGEQLPANTFAPPGIFGNAALDPEVGIFYAPDKASAELAEAGYPNGQDFPAIVLMHNTSEGHARIAQAIQQMWQETLGVTVEIENQEWKVYLQTLKNSTPLEEMPHMWRMGWVADYPDQNNWLHEVFNPEAGPNRSRLAEDDPLVGDFIKEFAELTRLAGEEQDPAKRVEMYRQAEHLLVYEIVAMAPIYYYTKVNVAKPYLDRNYPALGGNDFENWRMNK